MEQSQKTCLSTTCSLGSQCPDWHPARRVEHRGLKNTVAAIAPFGCCPLRSSAKPEKQSLCVSAHCKTSLRRDIWNQSSFYLYAGFGLQRRGQNSALSGPWCAFPTVLGVGGSMQVSQGWIWTCFLRTCFLSLDPYDAENWYDPEKLIIQYLGLLSSNCCGTRTFLVVGSHTPSPITLVILNFVTQILKMLF